MLDGVTENVQTQIDAKAADSAVVHLAEDETISGAKTFTGKVVMNSSDNVGIGTTAPSEKLEVTGNIKATKFKGDGSELTNVPYPVTSVAGKTGAVTLAKGDVGLSNVDNTSDVNKPISNATQAALNDKQSKITANGILKGDGNGNITAADLPIRAESIIIPKGRMRGDINGTGKVGTSDDVLNSQYFSTDTDPANPDSWVCDINADGKINASDMQAILSGILYSRPLIADYYNSWTYVKVDDLTGYWTTEISIAGLTTSNNVVVNICETFSMGQFYKAEVSTGKVKIYATTPPITDIPAIIVISSGSGKGSIPSYLDDSSVQPEIFIATYGTTTSAEIEAAYRAGKIVLCKDDTMCYFFCGNLNTMLFTTAMPDYPGKGVEGALYWVSPKASASGGWDNGWFKAHPNTHASTHASGGIDPIAPADIGAATMAEVNAAIQTAIGNAIGGSY